MMGGTTVYGATGNWPGWLALGGILYLGFVGRRTPRDAPPTPRTMTSKRATRRDDEEE